jgi:signal transduction histidine kinase
MDYIAAQESDKPLDELVYSYLTKTILFLSATAWIVFLGLWSHGMPVSVFGASMMFQMICLACLQLRRRFLYLVRHVLVIALGLWSLYLIWLTREPLVLLVAIPLGQMSGTLFRPRLAVGYAWLIIAGVAYSAHWLLPGQASFNQAILVAILTIIATALSVIWNENLSTALAWAYSSTREATERLAETREHRAKLRRIVKALDLANDRLQRISQMLVLARVQAEEAKEARNHFILAVSHELRSPLNFILGFSELMANSPATYAELDKWPPNLHDDILEINHSSNHLLRLINDVLDLGQIDAVQMPLVKERVSPDQLIEEVIEMVHVTFTRKGLWIRTEVCPHLPNVFADRTRIRQVLLNLITNSLRFTERGGITIRLETRQDSLLFCVKDTGPGIAEEDVPRVFEEFQQLNQGTWRRREGTGLGLPISRRLVELHGGHMWLESQVGEGTSIYFTLPLAETARDLPSPKDGVISSARYDHCFTEVADAKRLLVLSSDPVAGEVIARQVEDYSVASVISPSQICQRVAEVLPAALILGRDMLEDEQVQSALGELPYDLPVISFVFPFNASRPASLSMGVPIYLVKPIARQALIEAVQALGPGVRSLLVVDDDPAMVRFVTRVLNSGESPNGGEYRLVTAFTGTEALQRLHDGQIDAILLDLALPDISGWQVIDHMQMDPILKKLPVIVLTAHDRPQKPSCGDRDVLQIRMRRPLSRPELTSVLACLLETIRPLYPLDSIEPAHPAGPAE